jgi:hypothetical protein
LVEAFINDHLPFTDPMQKTIQNAYVALIQAQHDGDQELAEQLEWAYILLFYLAQEQQRFGPITSESVVQVIDGVLGKVVSWNYPLTLDHVVRMSYEVDGKVADAMSRRAVDDKVWHLLVHSVLEDDDPRLAELDGKLSPDARAEWCTVPEQAPIDTPLIKPGELVLVFNEYALPPELVQFMDGDYLQEDALVEYFSPLSDEHAKLLAHLKNVFHLTGDKRNPSTYDYELNERLFWLFSLFDPIHDEGQPEDYLRYLDAQRVAMKGYPSSEEMLSAGYLENLLNECEDLWPYLARRALDDPDFIQLLHGVWIRREVATRMPPILADNVTVLG